MAKMAAVATPMVPATCDAPLEPTDPDMLDEAETEEDADADADELLESPPSDDTVAPESIDESAMVESPAAAELSSDELLVPMITSATAPAAPVAPETAASARDDAVSTTVELPAVVDPAEEESEEAAAVLEGDCCCAVAPASATVARTRAWKTFMMIVWVVDLD